MYRIVSDKSTVSDVLVQVKAIKTFPCTVHLYDRLFRVDTLEEKEMLVYGLEIGCYLTDECKEDKAFEKGKDHTIHWHRVEGTRWEQFSQESQDENFKKEYGLRADWHKECVNHLTKLNKAF